MKLGVEGRKNYACLLGVVFLVGVLSGCSGLPKQPLDRKVAAGVTKIALVEAREPDKYETLNFGHPGMFFGAIGGFVAAADMDVKGGQLTDALRARGFAIAPTLTQRVAGKLQRNGYQVERVGDLREIKDGKLTLDYSKIVSDADAVLSISPTLVGFISTRGINSYRPALGLVAELVAKNRQDVLYREYFMYGWETSAGKWVHVPAPPAYSFGNFDDLIAQSPLAADGLMVGAEELSERLTRDFPRR